MCQAIDSKILDKGGLRTCQPRKQISLVVILVPMEQM